MMLYPQELPERVEPTGASPEAAESTRKNKQPQAIESHNSGEHPREQTAEERIASATQWHLVETRKGKPVRFKRTQKGQYAYIPPKTSLAGVDKDI
jgi:hypothetical protein